jgi:hypothetical protein
MPCLVGCLALAFPRLALFLVWLFGGGYLGRAYDSWIFPVLGFFFLPTTTLVFAFGVNSLRARANVTDRLALTGCLARGHRLAGGGRARSWRDSRDRADDR